MKKCLLMFALLIAVLLLTVFTEVEKNPKFEQEFVIGKDIIENTMLANESRDSIRGRLK
ncbi:hypothetical protein [Pricia sp.]|uniref:hypothetical protein n=1 Tax=Pricia sp. TaxID=2268138 RepID=UPI0035938A98